eukprot:TRINITY_DN1790_c0_g1_i1.p1 TRINITY_DN1790_c0_g1~~TRINITY_DN1790_c0_g1_i1.p1  ORF type:complete len:300 (+),score=33.20 TRINITY_DN1790_c0_g1_i1:266-1165(+)
MSLKCVIRVIEARGLRAADTNGKSDPYAIVKIRGTQKTFRTKIVYKTLSPMWNEEFTFQPISANDVLEIKVWDHDTVTGDDFLGTLEIPVSSYMNGPQRDEWKALVAKKGGLGGLLSGGYAMKNAGDIHLQIYVGTGFPQPSGMGGYPQQYPQAYPQQQGPYRPPQQNGPYAPPSYPQQSPYAPPSMPQQGPYGPPKVPQQQRPPAPPSQQQRGPYAPPQHGPYAPPQQPQQYGPPRPQQGYPPQQPPYPAPYQPAQQAYPPQGYPPQQYNSPIPGGYPPQNYPPQQGYPLPRSDGFYY